MKSLASLIEAAVLGARWILVIFSFGLIAALLLYAASFIEALFKLAFALHGMAESQIVLAMLNLIDATLVAGLIVMVMISSFENYVSRIASSDVDIAWLGKLDVGSLKIKVASSIVAISAIHLLEAFLNLDAYDSAKLMWLIVMQLTFVVSALLLAVIDRIAGKHE